jgi:hypothetical protein
MQSILKNGNGLKAVVSWKGYANWKAGNPVPRL